MPAVLLAVREYAAECVVLSTCNRFELYALISPLQTTRSLLRAAFGDAALDAEPFLHEYRGSHAAEHLFRVAASLDSLILGEVQILGQVQRAWQVAHRTGTVGAVLSQLFHRAVALGKRVHSETLISRQPASVSYAAVVLARQIFGRDLSLRKVLVIGTGEVGEGVARCLYEHGVHATVVAHRHIERAAGVAGKYNAELAGWEELPAQLGLADIVITSTTAPHTILQRRHIAAAMSGRADRPLYLIDLAVPRDIDPAAASLEHVQLHNIDDLQAVVHTGLAERQAALPQIEGLIRGETPAFERWLLERAATPTIRRLHALADESVQHELQWAFAKLPELSAKERQVVEAMAHRLRGKLLHEPVQWLKAQAVSDQIVYTLERLAPGEIGELFYTAADDEHGEEQREIKRANNAK